MTHKKRSQRKKHVPQRTCLACRQVAGKRALIRLVRTEKGVEVDETGKRAGRGAYLHPQQSCWHVALQGNQIERALRTRISPENRASLDGFMRQLPPTEESVGKENEDSERRQ